MKISLLISNYKQIDMEKYNRVFLGYYSLVRFKWSYQKTQKWIFSGKKQGLRYLECTIWNELWKSVFSAYGLNNHNKTLSDFFLFNLSRYRKSTYPPAVSSLFNNKSMKLFVKTYKKKNFSWYISLAHRYKAMLEISKPIEMMPDSSEVYKDKELDEITKRDCIEKAGYNELFDCCVLNDIHFSKDSKICKKCMFKKRCQVR